MVIRIAKETNFKLFFAFVLNCKRRKNNDKNQNIMGSIQDQRDENGKRVTFSVKTRKAMPTHSTLFKLMIL